MQGALLWALRPAKLMSKRSVMKVLMVMVMGHGLEEGSDAVDWDTERCRGVVELGGLLCVLNGDTLTALHCCDLSCSCILGI